jgi:uncharacterized protein YbjT (DUF2867 family)
MKVAVIGATGQTGSRAAKLLLDRGDEVTAFARDPKKLGSDTGRLRVVQGDARDSGALSALVQGQDAVLVAFGPRALGRDDVQEVLMRNLVAAMKQHGVKRMVNLSAWGMGATAAHGVWFFKHLIIPLMLRHVAVDKARGEEVLLASGLDFVNVSPGRLVNTAARGGVKASLDGRGLKPVLTRDDLAAFMVQQLTDPTWVGKSPIIGY